MSKSVGCAERITLSLRDLYDRYGYRQYKMSKFEEYDLYARNKDFLVSGSVITFTDLSGKLMALKPDVTLSIVKNSLDQPGVRKLYYHENVYRIAKGDQGYREIMQVGLEAIGEVDNYTISEVLLLAAKSLRSISEQSVLDVSHLGLLSELLDTIGIPYQPITPQKWKKEFGLNADKANSIDVCKRLYPGVNLLRTERSRKEDDNCAEAVLLATYAKRKF